MFAKKLSVFIVLSFIITYLPDKRKNAYFGAKLNKKNQRRGYHIHILRMDKISFSPEKMSSHHKKTGLHHEKMSPHHEKMGMLHEKMGWSIKNVISIEK
ncbi:MAG: hypothetical protein LBK58_13540 [Prevotellaceae bacterium]|jgi:hypothetical protein|nr:hypothetical protein [Prevotellaceae bacterium]